MNFMKAERVRRLRSSELKVNAKNARLHAQLQLCSGVAARTRGVLGWERGRMPARPTIIYDLSGLPLFYDFPVRRGRENVGFIRTAANKILGDAVISTQVGPRGWKLSAARSELAKLLEKKYRAYTVKGTKLVCYSYPKLALQANVVPRGGNATTVLMDVGDFTEIPNEPGDTKKGFGQIPYSLLNEIPEDQEIERSGIWEKTDRKVESVFQTKPQLDSSRMYKLVPKERLKVIDKAIAEIEIMKLYTERVLDYCCHSGDCKDHECFCLHPQENSVHCARASGQMMLCFWRYCYSQHEIAVAYGVADTALTPVGAVVPGLESLTHNCFDATLDWTVSWSDCANEIIERRPFMSCIPGHARACAGTKQWNIWVAGTPRPRYLYIFDPWPPNVGAVYWENYNTTSHMCMFTLKRRTTNHV